jgi:hypothetical protein
MTTKESHAHVNPAAMGASGIIKSTEAIIPVTW